MEAMSLEFSNPQRLFARERTDRNEVSQGGDDTASHAALRPVRLVGGTIDFRCFGLGGKTGLSVGMS